MNGHLWAKRVGALSGFRPTSIILASCHIHTKQRHMVGILVAQCKLNHKWALGWGGTMISGGGVEEVGMSADVCGKIPNDQQGHYVCVSKKWKTEEAPPNMKQNTHSSNDLSWDSKQQSIDIMFLDYLVKCARRYICLLPRHHWTFQSQKILEYITRSIKTYFNYKSIKIYEHIHL